MGTILPFLKEASFDPEITAVMGDAFDRACAKLESVDWSSDRIREVLAKCIISHAQQGERSAGRLAEAALSAIGFSVVNNSNGIGQGRLEPANRPAVAS